MPDVITANRLADGVVVFQTADSGLERGLQPRAPCCPTPRRPRPRPRARSRMRRAISSSTPYAFPVEVRNGHVVPKALREAIRAAGPTVRRDLGKQAQGLAPLTGPTAFPEADHVSL